MVGVHQSEEHRHVTATTPLDLQQVNPDDFEVRTLDDEIRVDELCGRLLLAVRDRLVTDDGLDPLAAGTLCHGADHFLREFVIAACGDNLFHLTAERVRQFAGHWYIIHALEPAIGELAGILAGVSACCQVLARHGLLGAAEAEAIGAACADLPCYQQRIDAFWAIEGDGYPRWQAVCPLPEGCR